ncbi:hypothetical protein M2T70_01725 [Elizabethkingia anophelis]|uniref:FISUMP domain-containing protein n=1 Tax=Elizabethkingia anophelis TaxID=1117645 RepID=UPI0009954B81|nr:FISUMP domain-containing protein [Elizabethkingia anophelis]AQW98627.1 hypothetical protein BBD31_12285 [Elizabethkingia anophelis]AQX89173.1 hypothetical protein AYC67_09105 [Elizabethkingia anophelis]ASV78504.1 hypothetical protein A6J37_07650 [Elizabethkingia anophelis]AVF49889.1 hypothetical protein AL491_18230 [Elizabethkingia anophelis]AVF50510.1 hypothetical protein AL492_02240 [Elizabethkingia anophelis]
MQLNNYTKTYAITAFLLLASCRTNDSDNTLKTSDNAVAVQVNLLSTDYADPTIPQTQASLKKEVTVLPAAEKNFTILSPSIFAETTLSYESRKLGTQASLEGTVAAVNGGNMNTNNRFRVIAYRADNGAYAAHKDYIITPTGITPDGTALMLDSGTTYNMIVYSYNQPTNLPAISQEELAGIGTAKIRYGITTEWRDDLLYQRIDGFTPNGNLLNNPLNITLRHKTALLKDVTVSLGSVDLEFITLPLGKISFTDYKNGELYFSGTNAGKITSRTNAFSGWQQNGMTYRGDTRKIYLGNGTVILNADTATDPTSKASFLSDITLKDNSTGNIKIQSITASFTIKPEYIHNFNIDIKKCGAYIAPGVWKEFACHNLGANKTLDPFTPAAGLHGDKYQWGALKGENLRYVSMADDQSIYNNNAIIFNWRTFNEPKPNDSWDGTKDPCTTELGVGWRVPTRAEWDSVLNPALNPQQDKGTFSTNGNDYTNYTAGKMFGKGLFLPAAGIRDINGALSDRNNYLYYWSKTVFEESTDGSYALSSGSQTISTSSRWRACGMPIRCIRD